MCSPTRYSYSPPSYNIFQQNFVRIFPNNRATLNMPEHLANIIDQTLLQIIIGNYEEKIPQINISDHFSSRKPQPKISNKTLLDSSMTHLIKIKISNKFIIGGEHFFQRLRFFIFGLLPFFIKFFDTVSSILKTINFSLCIT